MFSVLTGSTESFCWSMPFQHSGYMSSGGGGVSALPKADSSPQRAKQPLLQLLLNTRDLLKSVTSTHSTISHTCTISIATASENTPPPLVLNGFNCWWKEVLLFLLAKHLATVAQKSLTAASGAAWTIKVTFKCNIIGAPRPSLQGFGDNQT